MCKLPGCLKTYTQRVSPIKHLRMHVRCSEANSTKWGLEAHYLSNISGLHKPEGIQYIIEDVCQTSDPAVLGEGIDEQLRNRNIGEHLEDLWKELESICEDENVIKLFNDIDELNGRPTDPDTIESYSHHGNSSIPSVCEDPVEDTMKLWFEEQIRNGLIEQEWSTCPLELESVSNCTPSIT